LARVSFTLAARPVGHKATSVVDTVNAVGVQWANRLVSAGFSLLQVVTTMDGAICSTFQLRAARFSLLTRTFNPEVAGSSPARPMRKSLQVATFRVCCLASVRTGCT